MICNQNTKNLKTYKIWIESYGKWSAFEDFYWRKYHGVVVRNMVLNHIKLLKHHKISHPFPNERRSEVEIKFVVLLFDKILIDLSLIQFCDVTKEK